ncbi:MAG TPA: hypothetical protein DCY13_00700 [Verrucomicrobiales bacterium]|nr:hypothetical protein [Verrucomicrobiales bacterium]
MTPDGRYLVFQSAATNLVPAGTMPPSSNSLRTLIYRLDRQTDQMRLINVFQPMIEGSANALTNVSRDIVWPQISPDGQRVLFELGRSRHPASASWLNDAIEARMDTIFLWNAVNGVTDRVSVRQVDEVSQFANRPAMSDDGRYIAFARTVQDVPVGDELVDLGKMNVVVRDRQESTNVVPIAFHDPNAGNTEYTLVQGLSADGRWLLYSKSGWLYGGDFEAYKHPQLWLHDVLTGAFNCITTNSALGEIGNGISDSGTISADGNWTAYFSSSSNLVSGDLDTTMDVFLYDRIAETTTLVSTQPEWLGNFGERSDAPPKLTPDGRYLLYQAVGVGLFRYDRVAGTNALVTTDVVGDEADISADGRFVAFTAKPSSIDPLDPNPHRNVYVHDFETGVTELASPRDPSVTLGTAMAGTSLETRGVSHDGRFIAFTSTLLGVDDRANGQPLLWVRDTQLGTNILVSVDKDGAPLADGFGFREVQITADGRWVCFLSASSNLVAVDTNKADDVFLRDLVFNNTRLVSRSRTNTGSAAGHSFAPVLARDGSVVVFKSFAQDIAGIGTWWDLYLHELESNQNSLVTTNYYFGYRGDGLSNEADLHQISEDGRWLAFRTRDMSNFIPWAPVSTGSQQPVAIDLVTLARTWMGADSTGASLFNAPVLSSVRPGEDGSRFVIIGRDLSSATSVRAYTFDPVAGYSTLMTSNFVSLAWNGEDALILGRTNHPASSRSQLFRRGLYSGIEALITQAPVDGAPAGAHSYPLAVGPGGRYALFRSTAGNLALDDDNQLFDLFLHDSVLNVNILLSRSAMTGKSADGNTSKAVFTRDGNKVVFESFASDIVPGDANFDRDIFIVTLASADSDNDGLADDWEMAYFGNLNQTAATDFDQDGLTESAELAAGTSPINSASVLRAITVNSIGAGTTRVLWASVPGRRYQVQYRDGFEAPGWTPLGGEVIASATTSEATEMAPTGGGQRFYRILLVQ